MGPLRRCWSTKGFELVDSTKFLEALMPEAGVLTRRAPDEREAQTSLTDTRIARQIAGMDLGQTVVVRDRACVAIEAMEGTDETIERAARIAGGQSLVVVKVSKPRQDMRFDVPVIGLEDHRSDAGGRVSALAIDARTHAAVRSRALIEAADEAGIAIEAFAPEVAGEAKESAAGKRKS